MDTNRLAQQYAKNADGLEKMAEKARATGKKVGGYTLEQLIGMAADYRALATNGAALKQQRRDLMAQRDAALSAGDIARFHALTAQIAELPVAGVPRLTDADKARWSARG